MFIMARPKGGKNKNWTQEEKLRIVKRYFDEGVGQRTIAKQEGISRGMIYQWINKYRDGGPEALIPSKRTGNPFAALYNSKSMSEVDRLKLLVAKGIRTNPPKDAMDLKMQNKELEAKLREKEKEIKRLNMLVQEEREKIEILKKSLYIFMQQSE